MSIPTLADHLAGSLPATIKPPPTRVHRLEGDKPWDDGKRERALAEAPPVRAPVKPVIAPFNPTIPKEPAMPPKKPESRTRLDGSPVGAARFVIDDRGGMEIRDGQQVIQLEADDVARLAAFVKRHGEAEVSAWPPLAPSWRSGA